MGGAVPALRSHHGHAEHIGLDRQPRARRGTPTRADDLIHREAVGPQHLHVVRRERVALHRRQHEVDAVGREIDAVDGLARADVPGGRSLPARLGTIVIRPGRDRASSAASSRRSCVESSPLTQSIVAPAVTCAVIRRSTPGMHKPRGMNLGTTVPRGTARIALENSGHVDERVAGCERARLMAEPIESMPPATTGVPSGMPVARDAHSGHLADHAGLAATIGGRNRRVGSADRTASAKSPEPSSNSCMSDAVVSSSTAIR